MTMSERWLLNLIAGFSLGLFGWVLWVNVGSPVTLRWPHPGQPTAYFTWRSRPLLVRDGVGKAVHLMAGKKYVLAVRPPGQYTRGLVRIHTQEQSATLPTLTVGDQTLNLVPNDRGGHVEFALHDLPWLADGYHLQLSSPTEMIVTSLDINFAR